MNMSWLSWGYPDFAKLQSKLKALRQADRAAKTVDEKLDVTRRLLPDIAGYARKFVGLAKEEPQGAVASDALYSALQLQPLYTTGRLSPEGAEALALLQRDHVTSPKMGMYIEQLSWRPWAEVEPLLRKVLERNPDRTARGHACLGLAVIISRTADLPKLANDPSTARGLEEFYGKERLAGLLKQDVEANLREATKLYERVLAEFADVKYSPDFPDDRETLRDKAERL